MLINNKISTSVHKCFSKTWYGKEIISVCKYFIGKDLFHTKMGMDIKGSVRIRKFICGGGNFMRVGKGSLLNRVDVIVIGNNNSISIGENCLIGKNCKLYLEGNNMSLTIGNGCTFSHDDELLLQEDDSRISIGDNCMFSHHINVRTSDSHPIYDIDSGHRVNEAKDVNIGNHVWVTPCCIIQKGVSIGNGSIIATSSIVTKDIPQNCVAAGMPAKVVKQNVTWSKFFNE